MRLPKCSKASLTAITRVFNQFPITYHLSAMSSNSRHIIIYLIALVLLGLILPNGIRAAVANNVWSVSFVKAYIAEALTSRQLETALKTHPHAKLLQARVAMENGDYQSARQLLEPFSPTSDPALLETRAELLFTLERYPEALEIWESMGLFNKIEHAASALRNKGEVGMAILALQKAYGIRPHVYERSLINALLGKADNLRNEDQFVEAIILYQSIIDQFPDDVGAYSGLAWSYWFQGQSDLAVSIMDKAMSLPSQNYRFLMSAGSLFEQSGNTEEALAAYRKALSLSPNSQDPINAIERLTNPQ